MIISLRVVTLCSLKSLTIEVSYFNLFPELCLLSHFFLRKKEKTEDAKICILFPPMENDMQQSDLEQFLPTVVLFVNK